MRSMYRTTSLCVTLLVASVASGQTPVRSGASGGGRSSGDEATTLPGPGDWLERTIVVDGADRTAYRSAVLSTRSTPESGAGMSMSFGESTCQACGSVESAWTSTVACAERCGGEAEEYSFQVDLDPTAIDPLDISLVTRIKVPAGGLPAGFAADIVIVRCAPRSLDNDSGEDICMTPRPPLDRLPVLIIDDAEFDPLPADPNGCPYQAVVSITLPNLANLLAGSCAGPVICCFDWFEVVEFQPSSCPDVDADGRPDVAFLIDRDRRMTFCLTPRTDNFGAEVIDFVANRRRLGLSCLNILEAHPPAPARGCPDVQPGEDALTRPWCFCVDGPLAADGGGDDHGLKDGGAILSGARTPAVQR